MHALHLLDVQWGHHQMVDVIPGTDYAQDTQRPVWIHGLRSWQWIDTQFWPIQVTLDPIWGIIFTSAHVL